MPQVISAEVLLRFASDIDLSSWKAVNDTVMGGASSGRMELSVEGKGVFTGEVSLENNGGFASVRGPRLEQSLGDCQGIALLVKGDGKRYRCGLRSGDAFDAVFHQAPFETVAGQWQQVKIPFTEFVPTYHGRQLSDDKRIKREDIRSVSLLISDRQEGPFRLELDWIKTF